MNDSPAQNSLELEVKNFGPIAEAKIDLRPFTVFVGPSNTGKSYLAILIYALHQYFNDRFRSDRFRTRAPLWLDQHSLMSYDSFWDNEDNQFPEETLCNLAQWLEHNVRNESEVMADGRIPLSNLVRSLVRLTFDKSDLRGSALVNRIFRCFGVDGAKALIRKGSRGGGHVVLRKGVSEDSELFVHRLTVSSQGYTLTTTIPEKTPMETDISNIISEFKTSLDMTKEFLSTERSNDESSKDIATRNLIKMLVANIWPCFATPLDLPAFYLPADRTGIMHAHTAVTSALIRRAPMAGLRQTAPTPILSGVLADFLEQLINLDTQPQDLKHERSDLGSKIEKAILNGTVDIQRSESGYPRFTYRQEGWKDDLPLMNTSSMVAEIAPVVLYLRHVVRPGNVLIVEEPESHLHPAMQVEFTRQLAALVRAGVRVIITTHSEWVLEELANIVRLSHLPKAERKGIAGGDVALRPEEVGAWLFQPKNRPRGSVVKEIPLDDDSGLFPSGFDEVAVALHNNWAEISSRDRGGANG